MIEGANQLFTVSVVPPSGLHSRSAVAWMRSALSDLWGQYMLDVNSEWVIVLGHDQRTDQPVIKGVTTDLANVMKLPHDALDHFNVARLASIEAHWGRIMLSWDARVPPDLVDFDNTLEMYRLDTDVTVRRSRAEVHGALHPRLIITAPTLRLWQTTRFKIVRNP